MNVTPQQPRPQTKCPQTQFSQRRGTRTQTAPVKVTEPFDSSCLSLTKQEREKLSERIEILKTEISKKNSLRDSFLKIPFIKHRLDKALKENRERIIKLIQTINNDTKGTGASIRTKNEYIFRDDADTLKEENLTKILQDIRAQYIQKAICVDLEKIIFDKELQDNIDEFEMLILRQKEIKQLLAFVEGYDRASIIGYGEFCTLQIPEGFDGRNGQNPLKISFIDTIVVEKDKTQTFLPLYSCRFLHILTQNKIQQ